MIIAVSDVHLGYENANESAFKKFLDERVKKADEIDHFVLVGDILDLWRRDPIVILIEYRDVLSKLQKLAKEVHYVVGNHDFHLLELKDLLETKWGIKISTECTLAEGKNDKKYKYYFIHGHQFRYAKILEFYEKFADLLCLSDDDIGKNASSSWEFLIGLYGSRMTISLMEALLPALIEPKRRLGDKALSKVMKRAQELSKRMKATIIYGHTHQEAFKEKSNPTEEWRIANAGCWVTEPGYPSENVNKYLKIDGDSITEKESNI